MKPALRSIGKASAFWFILPCLLVLAVTSLYPVGFGLVVSTTNWNWGNQFDFVGASNYAALLGDAEFWTVLRNTVVFATFATAVEVALGGALVRCGRARRGAGGRHFYPEPSRGIWGWGG